MCAQIQLVTVCWVLGISEVIGQRNKVLFSYNADAPPCFSLSWSMSESAVMTILFSTRVSEDPLFTTFEMWVVVVVTEVPLVVSEVMVWELDTVEQSLSSSVPSTVTPSALGRGWPLIPRVRKGECVDRRLSHSLGLGSGTASMKFLFSSLMLAWCLSSTSWGLSKSFTEESRDGKDVAVQGEKGWRMEKEDNTRTESTQRLAGKGEDVS